MDSPPPPITHRDTDVYGPCIIENRQAHPRHAHNHPETTIPKDGHTQTQPDSRWFRFTAIHISEVVMNAKSHSISVHIIWPSITVIILSPSILYSAVPPHSTTEKHTVSLHADSQVTQTGQ